MAITTVQGIIDGMLPTFHLQKAAQANVNAAGHWSTNVYSGGFPTAMTAASSGASGAAITSRNGLVSFPNPPSGETRLSKLQVRLTSGWHAMLVDRLWDNSGLSVTDTSAQTVNSATLPARDINGSTNGAGVYAAVEVTSTVGAGTPTFTLDYTNSAGTTGRTAAVTVTVSAPTGMWWIFGLNAGDVGIRSIQDFTASATSTSGSFCLVLFRPVFHFGSFFFTSTQQAQRSQTIDDAISMIAPKLLDNTCLQYVGGHAGNASASALPIMLTASQG